MSPSDKDDRPAGGLSIKTLLFAALGSATAAVVTSAFWPKGSILSAALTPVIVALVSELLRHPTDRIAGVATGSTGGRRSARRRAGGVSVEERPYRVYGGRRNGPRIRLALVLATGGLAFVIAVVVLTVPERLFGGAVANDRPTTIFPSSPGTEEEEPKDEAAPATTGTSEETTPTTETQGDEPATTTVPEGQGEQPGQAPTTTPEGEAPAEPGPGPQGSPDEPAPAPAPQPQPEPSAPR